MAKTIAVVGASGIQGSSVARAFLALPNWQVRCLTRDPSSPKMKPLADLGGVIVQADMSDPESLARAFEDVHAIFVNTDFWTVYRPSIASGLDLDTCRELALAAEATNGRNAASAAASVPTLERFVYSALGPMKKASGGKYPHSYHWDGKAAIVDYILDEQPELAKKTSFIYVGAYATNPLLYPTLDQQTGEYTMVLPCPSTTRMPIIDAANSTGPFVRALVEDEEPGTKLIACDSYLDMGQILDTWSRVTGKAARFVEMPVEEMSQVTGIPREILDGPAFVGEFGYAAGISGVVEPEQLKKPMKTESFEEYLKKHNDLGAGAVSGPSLKSRVDAEL